jgi:hypothetical protein
MRGERERGGKREEKRRRGEGERKGEDIGVQLKKSRKRLDPGDLQKLSTRHINSLRNHLPWKK